MSKGNLFYEINFDEQPMDVDFHPTESLLATAIVDGNLYLHKYSTTEAKELHCVKAHATEDGCRAVTFSLSGDLVLTASGDKSILAVDITTGKAKARKKDAHDAAINRLLAVSETVAASGDDNGCIKLWDSRQSDAIASFDAHSDFVSDLALHSHEQALLSVSGDGTLAVIDLRSKKLKATSEGDADDELLSIVAMKGGKKLVCGTTSGVLDIWSWGYWNDCSDRFPGHPESVTSLLRYDDETLISGSSDGLIRILNIQPNKMMGVLGEHADIDIERLAADKERKILASVAHVNTVKLWDLSILHDDGNDDDEEEEEDGNDGVETDKGKGAANKGAKDDSDDSDSDSDDGGSKKKKSKRKKKGQHKIQSKKHHKSSNFFSDLL